MSQSITASQPNSSDSLPSIGGTKNQQSVGQTIQGFRNQGYEYQLRHKNEVPKYMMLQHQLFALLTTRVLILGPLERIKVILQVKNLAQFVNPRDKPKNAFDLFNKIGNDQGLFAYYRGMNAMIYKIVIENTMRFALYETMFQHLKSSKNNPDFSLTNSVLAATGTAVITTTLTYPFDFAHGRMAADMSKKPSVYIEKSENNAANKGKLYSSVRDCITKAQYERGLSKSHKLTNLFKGYQSAIVGQVPYTVILMGTFEVLETFFNSQQSVFNKKDGQSFIYKLITRFGASTIAILLAQTICYPFDTVKRRMQLNGALGHKNIYRSDIDCFRRILQEEGAAKGLYAGFSVNLVKCLPMAVIQYIVFRAYRTISEKKEMAQRPRRRNDQNLDLQQE